MKNDSALINPKTGYDIISNEELINEILKPKKYSAFTLYALMANRANHNNIIKLLLFKVVKDKRYRKENVFGLKHAWLPVLFILEEGKKSLKQELKPVLVGFWTLKERKDFLVYIKQNKTYYEFLESINTNLKVIERINENKPQDIKYIELFNDGYMFGIGFSIEGINSVLINFNRVINLSFKPIVESQSLELGVIYEIQSDKAEQYNIDADRHKKELLDKGIDWPINPDYSDRFGAILGLKHYLLPISNKNCIELLATDYSITTSTKKYQDYLISFSKYRK